MEQSSDIISSLHQDSQSHRFDKNNNNRHTCTRSLEIDTEYSSSKNISKNNAVHGDYTRFHDPNIAVQSDKRTEHQNSFSLNVQKDEEDIEDYDYDDEEIQKDAANEAVAFAIYVALAFFLLLFFGATVGAIIIVSDYGFFVFMVICLLMFTMMALGHFIWNMMERDRVLKPMRRKIRRWHAVATAVVVQEMKNFHLDLNDNFLLLTNGVEFENGDDDTDQGADSTNEKGKHKKKNKHKNRRGPRSKLFGLLVQPLLKKKNRSKFKFSTRSKVKSTANPEKPDHVFV
mmetsp:Transcript_13732/g.15437  ORF Transcript_13732/g.15437 Transcript_13732/m.15437 type:complete len:287 (-) Transcript_13732:79-939(-)